MPRTRSKLERIDPNMEAWTTTTRFWLREMIEMINSTALPKEALSNPPMIYDVTRENNVSCGTLCVCTTLFEIKT